jgi:Domain of unknown function (DUF4124)
MTLIFKLNKPRLIILLTFLFAGAASADVYKWVDKDGKVHYSDAPPVTGEGKKLKQKIKDPGSSAPAANGTAAKPTTSVADQDLEFRKRKMEQEEAEKKKKADKELAEQNKGHCNSLRGDLRAHNDGMRITKYNDKGERVFLDNAQRAESKAKLEEAIARDCK